MSTADVDTWRSGPAPGEVLPEVALGAGTGAGHLTQQVGPGFVLLHVGAAPAGLDTVAGLRVVEAGAQVAAAFDAQPGSAYLLRPDGHVAARWKHCTAAAVQQAMQRALGFTAEAALASTDPSSLGGLPPAGTASPRDRLYTRLAHGITEAGSLGNSERETLFLARLALLLFEKLDDETAALAAIAAALQALPEPSLSAAGATY